MNSLEDYDDGKFGGYHTKSNFDNFPEYIVSLVNNVRSTIFFAVKLRRPILFVDCFVAILGPHGFRMKENSDSQLKETGIIDSLLFFLLLFCYWLSIFEWL